MTDAPLIRAATLADAAAMSAVLAPILAGWGSARQGDPETVWSHYIRHPDRVACSVAVVAGRILGFQSLKRAAPDNPYGVTPGWGIIGSYVAPEAAGQGVGRALFAASAAAARDAGLPWIDATIGAGNAGALAYYGAMGFEAYRRRGSAICKRYRVAPA